MSLIEDRGKTAALPRPRALDSGAAAAAGVGHATQHGPSR